MISRGNEQVLGREGEGARNNQGSANPSKEVDGLRFLGRVSRWPEIMASTDPSSEVPRSSKEPRQPEIMASTDPSTENGRIGR